MVLNDIWFLPHFSLFLSHPTLHCCTIPHVLHKVLDSCSVPIQTLSISVGQVTPSCCPSTSLWTWIISIIPGYLGHKTFMSHTSWPWWTCITCFDFIALSFLATSWVLSLTTSLSVLSMSHVLGLLYNNDLVISLIPQMTTSSSWNTHIPPLPCPTNLPQSPIPSCLVPHNDWRQHLETHCATFFINAKDGVAWSESKENPSLEQSASEAWSNVHQSQLSSEWNNHLLSDRVVKLPALVALRVSNKHTLLQVAVWKCWGEQPVAGMDINEGDTVVIHLMCVHLDRAMHISVDELEGLWGSGGQRREGDPSFAGFMYWIRVCLWIKLKTHHQVAWLQLLDVDDCQLMVAEVTKPEVPVQREVVADEREAYSSTGNVIFGVLVNLWLYNAPQVEFPI